MVGASRFELETSCAQGRRVISWKPLLCNVVPESKRPVQNFGGGKKYQTVDTHAQSPPNFPHRAQYPGGPLRMLRHAH